MGINSFILGLAKNGIKGLSTNAGNALNQLSQGDIGALDPRNLIQGDLGANVSSAGIQFGDARAGMAARGDAIQNWAWYCLLPTLGNPNTFALLGEQAATPLPWYYVQKTNLPQRTIEAESIKRNAHQVHLPTSYSVPNLTLEFFLDTHNKAHQYLKAWGALVLDTASPKLVQNQGVWGLPANYKKDIAVYVLGPTKQQLLIFRYMRCWPSDPAALELSSSDPAALSQTVNFFVEDVEVTVLNDKGLVSNLLDSAQGYALSAVTGVLPSVFNG